MATVDLQSTNESGMLYYDHEQIKGQLNGLDTSDSINDKLNTLQTYTDNYGLLGEIRQIALSMPGALTKSQLQARGWAICDGTTPESQGISSPTITTTPDLREKFLRHSADETTGGTGGTATHSHTTATTPYSFNTSGSGIAYFRDGITGNDVGKITDASLTGGATSTLPPYYDICYFIKVK